MSTPLSAGPSESIRHGPPSSEVCVSRCILSLQGTQGTLHSLPACMAGHMGAMADSEAAGHCLVRWQLPQMLAAGQFLLLVEMLRELRGLQQVRLTTPFLLLI